MKTTRKILTGTAAVFLFAAWGCQKAPPEPVALARPATGLMTAPAHDDHLNDQAQENAQQSPGENSAQEEETVELSPYALAELSPTDGYETSGIVSFMVGEPDLGVRIIAEFIDIPAGSHGFHIHENGDCSAPDASSAGAHFNPTQQLHGARGHEQRHVGDLGNLIADANNLATLDFHDDQLSFEGVNSIVGKAVIVHAGEDDLHSQPAGDAGDRIACGVIVLSDIHATARADD